MAKSKQGHALTYRSILLLVATVVLILDITLGAVLYINYISPNYTQYLYSRMQNAYHQVADNPTGSFHYLERENIYVLIADRNGALVYASLDEQEENVEELCHSVDQAAVLPLYQGSGSDKTGQLSLLGRSSGYYICVSMQLEPIFAVATMFLHYSILIGVVLWVVTLLFVVLVERQLFAPITEAVQVAKRIARQDFSQKCGQGGIARQSQALASSLNNMSEQLQATLQQLQQANKQLKQDINTIERSENAMKNLVSNLSHDLKTPLALISGYAEGLSAGMAKTQAERQEYCAIILDETERMRQIITRMLELSQLESGQVRLEEETFDVAQLLDHTLNQFHIQMEKERIQLTRDYPASLLVRTDYVACDQVLTNLIQNAVYHSAAPKHIQIRAYSLGSAPFNREPDLDSLELPDVAVTLPVTKADDYTQKLSLAEKAVPSGADDLPEAQSSPADSPAAKRSLNPVRFVGAAWSYLRSRGQSGELCDVNAAEEPVASPARVRIEIFNTSAPIEPKQMEHLFDRFYRGEQSRKRANGEMGLGLAIVRCNMELLSMPYGVTNTANGVIFWIELPSSEE